LDHVPSKGTLSANQEAQATQFQRQGSRYLFGYGEVRERNDENDSNQAAKNSVTPLHVVNAFEVIKGARVIQPEREQK
jgi:hypothetical protein